MNSAQVKRGHLFLVTAPSGAGKTSLVRALLKDHPNIRFSISYTTRPRRPTETAGHDYFFVDKTEFQRMVAAGEFLEHAQVFDNHYGTARKVVEDLMAKGRDVLLEIDWQGAAQVRKLMPEAVSIFILPPSRGELERRLRSRGTDDDTVIARRLRDAVGDMSHWSEFDYVVVNDTFEHALTELSAIVTGRGQACRADRPALSSIVGALLA
ncbi:MAG TPA: guanylate kinase [Gammaproteobacteria bacterium]|nr:guanylate kinase [Gammaproteobacteria bacterium]